MNSALDGRRRFMIESGGNGNTRYYELGLDPNAGPQEIKKAFYRLALRYHPDRNPEDREAGEKFRQILDAYRKLTGKDEEEPSDQNEKATTAKIRETGFAINTAPALAAMASLPVPVVQSAAWSTLRAAKAAMRPPGRRNHSPPRPSW